MADNEILNGESGLLLNDSKFLSGFTGEPLSLRLDESGRIWLGNVSPHYAGYCFFAPGVDSHFI